MVFLCLFLEVMKSVAQIYVLGFLERSFLFQWLMDFKGGDEAGEEGCGFLDGL